MIPTSFNDWRRDYYKLTVQEQKAYHNKLEAEYPIQNHGDYSALNTFLSSLNSNIKVLEMGGWKGDMAKRMLSERFHLTSWTNIEICPNAAKKSIIEDIRYKVIVPEQFDWWNYFFRFEEYDAFIALHVIEHLTYEHVSQLLNRVKCKYLYFEVPLSEAQSWDNYGGTHIFDRSNDDLTKLILSSGYKTKQIYNSTCKSYVRI